MPSLRALLHEPLPVTAPLVLNPLMADPSTPLLAAVERDPAPAAD
jgi:hypothetical protein